MRDLEKSAVQLIADCVVARSSSLVIYAWCAAHPLNYKATICSSARHALAAHDEDIYCLPTYNAASEACTCSIRVDRQELFLNDRTPSVPLWMAIWHVQLLYRLFDTFVKVHVVDLDTVLLQTLLTSWESTEVTVATITTKRRLTACISQHRRLTGRLFRALHSLEELEVLPSPFEDAALAVAEHVPSLQRLSANACRVEYLKPLRHLHHLRELHLAQTHIRDRELPILAQLPLLQTLDVSGCTQLTTLDPLATSPSLRELNAANCERLVRVAQLCAVSTLRFVNLSENMFLPSEFASLLTRRPLKLRTAYFMHIRWPREDPPNVSTLLGDAIHLHLSYGAIPNIRWLCGAHNVEQLYLNHTNVTAADLAQLTLQMPFLRVLSVSYCEHLHTNLDFTRPLSQLSILSISPSSLPVPFPELEQLQRSMRITLS